MEASRVMHWAVDVSKPIMDDGNKLQSDEDDGIATVSTSGRTSAYALDGCSSDGSTSWSIGTATFRQDLPTMAFRPVHSIIQEEPAEDAALKELATVGAQKHAIGQCKPCAWFHKPKGCANGADCLHCHMCADGEIKARKQIKLAGLRKASRCSYTSEDTNQSTTAEEGTPSSYVRPPPGLDNLEAATGGGDKEAAEGSTTRQEVAVEKLPSVGSSLHAAGKCKPCAWLYKAGGCSNGAECKHCHLCPEGEIKSRKKEKVASLRRESKNTTQDGEADDDMDALPWTNLEYDMSPFGFAAMPPPRITPPIFFPDDSLGSAWHGTGMCRPCAWYWKPQGCDNGRNCLHCHRCSKGEIALRKKEKLAALRATDGYGNLPAEVLAAVPAPIADDMPMTVPLPEMCALYACKLEVNDGIAFAAELSKPVS